MTYVDSLISTGVDQLINLVYKEKRVNIDDAARKLGIARKVIEEWAHVLEDEGIIKMEYQFTTVYLMWAGEEAAQPDKVKELREQRDILLNEIESLSNKVSLYLAETREGEKKLAALIKDLSSVSQGVKTAVDTIAEIKNESKVANEEATKIMKEFESLMQRLNEKFSVYEKQLKDMERSYANDTNLAETLRKDYADLYEEVHKQVEEVSKHKKMLDDALEDIKKMEEGIRERLNAYTQLSNGTLKEDIKKSYEDFENVKKMYTDLYANLEKRLSDMHLALKTINDFSKDVDALEEKISESVIAQRYAEVKNIMEKLSEIEDEEERIDKKLKLLARELKSLNIEVPPTASEEVGKKLEEAKDKIKATKRETTLLEQKREELINLMKKIKESKVEKPK